MRMAKVIFLLDLFERQGLDLAGKSLLDYGFGAGTLFRYCPPSARLYGVELDPVCVQQVSSMLARRGVKDFDLQSLQIEQWSEHPLLARTYDVVICSHVLEHLTDPATFLIRMRSCLNETGNFVGLVPINERVRDPHHEQEVTRDRLETWLLDSGLCCTAWVEGDPWLYRLQPWFTVSSGWRYRIAQAMSLGLGLAATGCGFRLWAKLSRVAGPCTGSRPTQAGFILRPVQAKHSNQQGAA